MGRALWGAHYGARIMGRALGGFQEGALRRGLSGWGFQEREVSFVLDCIKSRSRIFAMKVVLIHNTGSMHPNTLVFTAPIMLLKSVFH
jgi:hypothetical protein